jgi:hypothetical protein
MEAAVPAANVSNAIVASSRCSIETRRRTPTAAEPPIP